MGGLSFVAVNTTKSPDCVPLQEKQSSSESPLFSDSNTGNNAENTNEEQDVKKQDVEVFVQQIFENYKANSRGRFR